MRTTAKTDMAETRIDWQQLIETALTTPGSIGNTYSRFHDYSIANMMLFRMQDIHEPVASASRWKKLGRQVVHWNNRKEVIVPVFAKEELPPQEDESLEEKRERVARLIGFKAVRAVFALSDTDGPELPPFEHPKWELDTALQRLNIRRVPFTELNGNIQGYAIDRDIAINPVAVRADGTLFHELGHVILGHTIATSHSEYAQHRGIMEAQAELTSYLVMNELGLMTEESASHSRGYVRHWLDNEPLTDRAARLVFSAADRILRSGRVEAESAPNAAPNLEG